MVNADVTTLDYTGTCSMCGKQLDLFDTQEDFSIHRHIGYGSKYDGDMLDIHLCCECMDKIIDSCKSSPITCTDD